MRTLSIALLGLFLSLPALATPFGPMPTIEVLGPGCRGGYAVPAGGTLRVTFQNVAQSCAVQRCSVIMDEPLDAGTMTVKLGDELLKGTFEKSGEMCGQRPVWVYSLPVPEKGRIMLEAKGAPAMSYHIKPQVDGMLVLDYYDFGPQAAAGKLLGQCWYQWMGTVCCDGPESHQVKVVVYHGIPLDDVKKAYAVDPEKKADFRYVTLADALAYLDSEIKEDVLQSLTSKLEDLRRMLVKRFGRTVKK